MRTWSWHKAAIQVNDGSGFVAVFDFEDFWKDHGDQATEEIAEFIVDACNAAEASLCVPCMEAAQKAPILSDNIGGRRWRSDVGFVDEAQEQPDPEDEMLRKNIEAAQTGAAAIRTPVDASKLRTYVDTLDA